MNPEATKISEPIGEAAPKKKKKKVFLIIDIILLVLIVISLCPISLMLYRNLAFGEVFFVNGMSMFPTLNNDAIRVYNGKEVVNRPMNWSFGEARNGDLVDYGWGRKANDKTAFLASLKRYDIVMCYFPSDYSSSSQTPHTNASLKIKRLIAFPGETITISYDPAKDDGSIKGYNVWGETKIVDTAGETKVLENLYTLSDYDRPEWIDSIGSYVNQNDPVTGNTRGAAVSKTWTLKENQYFVCGDNRRGKHSNDSRSVGPLSDYMLLSKAARITGLREMVNKVDDSGNIVQDAKFRIDHIRMPWDYINLEVHP